MNSTERINLSYFGHLGIVSLYLVTCVYNLEIAAKNWVDIFMLTITDIAKLRGC